MTKENRMTKHESLSSFENSSFLRHLAFDRPEKGEKAALLSKRLLDRADRRIHNRRIPSFWWQRLFKRLDRPVFGREVP